MPLQIIGIVCAAALCVASCGSDRTSLDDAAMGPPDMVTPGACTIRTPCAAGATCINGICRAGCIKDSDCRATEFCSMEDYVCHDRTVSPCPATPCASTQICVNGLCSTPPSGISCGRTPFSPADGCGPKAVCLANALVDGVRVPENECYQFPECPPGGACPPGSVCNNGLLEGKGQFCLAGMCTANSDCIKGMSCTFVSDPSTKYGECTDGAAGSVCAKPNDCVSLTCKQGAPTVFGFCK